MIFYFSGTGNSKFVAKNIADFQGDRLIAIPEELNREGNSFEYKLIEKELVGFVYPVYAWGPPQIVLDFIGRLKITGGKPYVFSLCTCGDEEGKTTKILEKALENKGIKLNSAFTIIMPNNYIISFDIDSKEVEKDKILKARGKLKDINEILLNRKSEVFDINPGSFPRLKSTVINPLFNKYGRSTKKFYSTTACTGCGLCQRVCPIHTIKVEKKPSWGTECTQCLGCINSCPTRAIQYGKGTVNKGRYMNSEV